MGDSLDQPKLPSDNKAVENPEELKNRIEGRDLFIRQRTLFGKDEIAEDLIKRPPLDVVIDLGDNSKDFLEKAAGINSKSFDRFVTGFHSNFGVSKDKLQDDPEFRAAFLEFRDLELDVRRRKKEKLKHSDLKQKVVLRLAGLVNEKNDNASKYCESYIKLEKDREIAKRISSLAVDTTDPKRLELVEFWRGDLQKLDEEYKHGKVTEEQYLARRDDINGKAVEASGDKELQETWQGYENDQFQSVDSSNDESESISKDPNEKPVDNANEVKKALADLSLDDNIELRFSKDGGASATIGKERFFVAISVFKNSETNQYVCYLVDKYSNGSYAKVETKDLVAGLDKRYIDCFISQGIGKSYKDPDAIPNVPDSDMVEVGEKLIGEGRLRNYRVEGENRRILEALVPILVARDSKYPGVYKKIEILKWYLSKKENVDKLRRLLLSGEKPTLPDILGDSY